MLGPRKVIETFTLDPELLVPSGTDDPEVFEQLLRIQQSDIWYICNIFPEVTWWVTLENTNLVILMTPATSTPATIPVFKTQKPHLLNQITI